MPPDLLCLVISLTRSTTRRQAISTALLRHGIQFRFLDAVDAAKGFEPQVETRLDRAELCRRAFLVSASDGEIACAFSHSLAYDRFLAGPWPHALIMEDDAIILPQLAEVIRFGAYRDVPMLICNHKNAWVRRWGSTPLVPGHRAFRLTLPPYMTVGYFLNRPAATELQRATRVITGLADWPMDISRLGACAAYPFLIGHPPHDDPAQSLLTQDRSASTKPKGLKRLLFRYYWRRKWGKFLATKIS